MGRTGTYADNAYNRAKGRAGMEMGSAVISRGSSTPVFTEPVRASSAQSSSGSTSVYVDNAYNRAKGRAGMEMGSAVISRGSSTPVFTEPVRASSAGRVTASACRTYVDNPMNRRLDRVGLPYGSSSSAPRVASTSGAASSSVRTYVDNPRNRKLGRVGLAYGTSSAGSDAKASLQSPARRVYVDNALNRKLGRVGEEIGTMPYSRGKGAAATVAKERQTDAEEQYDDYDDYQQREQPKFNHEDVSSLKETLQRPLAGFDPEGNEEFVRELLEFYRLQREAHAAQPDCAMMCDRAEGIINRHEANLTMEHHSGDLERPTWLEDGQIIDYATDVQLGEKLGSGAFGDVYVAMWKAKHVVAVKKLRFQCLTRSQKEKFQQEVLRLSSLNHPAVLKFYGACVASPDLAIVMEFMPAGSLYDVLHIEETQLEDAQKYGLASDMLSGLMYLHGEGVVHRDIKSMNIMVCVDFGHCKLADFGLALKDESTSSSSVADYTAVGTYRYCPAEVLEGLNLTIEQFKNVDVYAVALTITELYTETEPYKGMNVHQIQRAVKSGESPFAEEAGLPTSVQTMLQSAMHKDVSRRPTAEELFSGFQKCKTALLGPSVGLTARASVGVRA